MAGGGEVGGRDPEHPVVAEELPAAAKCVDRVVQMLEDVAQGDGVERTRGKGAALQTPHAHVQAACPCLRGRFRIGLEALHDPPGPPHREQELAVAATDVEEARFLSTSFQSAHVPVRPCSSEREQGDEYPPEPGRGGETVAVPGVQVPVPKRLSKPAQRTRG
jgi:hypothetical protein